MLSEGKLLQKVYWEVRNRIVSKGKFQAGSVNSVCALIEVFLTTFCVDCASSLGVFGCCGEAMVLLLVSFGVILFGGFC